MVVCSAKFAVQFFFTLVSSNSIYIVTNLNLEHVNPVSSVPVSKERLTNSVYRLPNLNVIRSNPVINIPDS